MLTGKLTENLIFSDLIEKILDGRGDGLARVGMFEVSSQMGG